MRSRRLLKGGVRPLKLIVRRIEEARGSLTLKLRGRAEAPDQRRGRTI